MFGYWWSGILGGGRGRVWNHLNSSSPLRPSELACVPDCCLTSRSEKGKEWKNNVRYVVCRAFVTVPQTPQARPPR